MATWNLKNSLEVLVSALCLDYARRAKAIEERIESREADDDDDEVEFVTPLSELFGIFSSNSKKDGEVEADEALPEN